MKQISRKEQIKTDIEYFIFCQNEKLKQIENLTFEFDVFDQCKEIENRYCVYFENMDEAIDVISDFDTHDYKTSTKKNEIELKLIGLLHHLGLNSLIPFWISFYVE